MLSYAITGESAELLSCCKQLRIGKQGRGRSVLRFERNQTQIEGNFLQEPQQALIAHADPWARESRVRVGVCARG
jgi:hypothetical protein